jgi:hypothetical protein
MGWESVEMTFKEKKKLENVAALVKQKKYTIAREIESEIEILFRKSQHSYWLGRCCRTGDDSHTAFMNGLISAVSVLLIPLWGDCGYDVKINLNSRMLRNHLANFLSPVLAGKSYRNKDLEFLAESLTADIDAEAVVPIDFCTGTVSGTKQRIGLHTKNRNSWFGKMVDDGRAAILQRAMGVVA